MNSAGGLLSVPSKRTRRRLESVFWGAGGESPQNCDRAARWPHRDEKDHSRKRTRSGQLSPSRQKRIVEYLKTYIDTGVARGAEGVGKNFSDFFFVEKKFFLRFFWGKGCFLRGMGKKIFVELISYYFYWQKFLFSGSYGLLCQILIPFCHSPILPLPRLSSPRILDFFLNLYGGPLNRSTL